MIISHKSLFQSFIISNDCEINDHNTRSTCKKRIQIGQRYMIQKTPKIILKYQWHFQISTDLSGCIFFQTELWINELTHRIFLGNLGEFPDINSISRVSQSFEGLIQPMQVFHICGQNRIKWKIDFFCSNFDVCFTLVYVDMIFFFAFYIAS